MQRSIVFGSREYHQLRDHLFGDVTREQAAFLLAASVETESILKILVREVVPLVGDDFVEHSEARLVIRPAALAGIMKRAAAEGASVVLVHTHPGATDIVGFSEVDDAGEPKIFANVERRVPGRPHASMVFGQRSVAARIWGAGRHLPVDRVVIVGPRLTVSVQDGLAGDDDRYDRQVRAFGAAGQRALARIAVGIVGCGGTGSSVAEQLLRLGVGKVIAVDPDSLEESNVTRVYGSSLQDARRATPKVEIVARLAQSLGRRGAVEEVIGDVRDAAVARHLVAADVLFGCTDSHASRLVLNRMAEQYLMPLIDMGTRIDGRGGNPRSVAGRVSVILPGSPCLFCAGVIRAEQIAAESLPDAQRRRLADEGYVQGVEDHAPAVISLNTVTAGLAVTEFLRLVSGFGRESDAGQIVYNADDASVRRTMYSSETTCWCMNGEAYAAGDTSPLPTR